MSASTESMTIKAARALGWCADIVTRWKGPVRKDLWGFADIEIVDDQPRSIVYVQATTAAHIHARMQKIDEIMSVSDSCAWRLLTNGHRIQVWGWKEYKLKRGGRKKEWRCRRMQRTLDGWLEMGLLSELQRLKCTKDAIETEVFP